MNLQRRSTRTLVLAALLPIAACNWTAATLSTEKAPWSYVEDAWGGVRLASHAISVKQLTVKLELGVHEVKRADSGICVRRVSARSEATSILVRFDRCLCSTGYTTNDYAASIPLPKPGRYVVAYDDEAAEFPKLGEVELR